MLQRQNMNSIHACFTVHAEKVLKSESLRLEHAIGRKTSPLSASLAYRQHWSLLMAGDKARAQAVLKELADKGVPLP